MIAGIGVDVCEIKRLEDSLARTPKLKQRLFHESEFDLANSSLAARFAIKEALAKAIGNPKLVTWNEITLEKNMLGKPQLKLFGQSQTNFEKLGVSSFVSISHDAGVAVAVVVLEEN